MPAIAKKGILYTETPSVENRVVEGNQNPVTSGAVYKELGDTSVNNDLGANVSNQIGNLHTQMQTNNGRVDGINGRLTQVQSQICTNILNPTAKTQTSNGVTLTNNGNGTYTVNGTASGQAVFPLMTFNNFALLENKKLIGCPAGGSPSTHMLYISGNRGLTWLWEYDDYGNGVIISNISSETTIATLHIIVRDGQTVNNLIFKPMLTTDLSATYDDFVPYTGGSGRLNEDVADLISEKSNLTNNKLDDASYVGSDAEDYFRLVKIGNIVFVNFRKMEPTSPKEKITIKKLPTEFIPKNEPRFYFVINETPTVPTGIVKNDGYLYSDSSESRKMISSGFFYFLD